MMIKRKYLLFFGLMAIVTLCVFFLNINCSSSPGIDDKDTIDNNQSFTWKVPDTADIPHSEEGDLIRYGRELISNTSYYLGRNGKIASLTNGMNCQNCHLEAGTSFLGNNYGSVYSTYPKFRDRSGSIENINKRINDCFERSLDAKAPLDTNSREVRAIYSYLVWLGKDVPKGITPSGTGIANLKFLNRAADTSNGKSVYLLNCERCHGTNGEGKLKPDGTGYEFPPLWGEHSFTTAAGLFRLSRFAGYVRFNMPFDAPYNASRLTDEEAWDVAAFVTSKPRPVKNFTQDWPDIKTKPYDYPFGPYADNYSEQQHKFGPFEAIIIEKKKITGKK